METENTVETELAPTNKKELRSGTKITTTKLQSVYAKIRQRCAAFKSDGDVVATLTSFNNWLGNYYITWETLVWFINSLKTAKVVDNKKQGKFILVTL